jgi:hypothetical protein
MVTMLLDASNGGGSDDQAEAEMGLIWSSGGNSNDISVIAGVGIVIVGIVIAGMGIVIVGIVIAGIVIVGIVIAGIVIVGIVIVGIVIAGMGIVAGTRPIGGLAFRPSFFRCMSCSK